MHVEILSRTIALEIARHPHVPSIRKKKLGIDKRRIILFCFQVLQKEKKKGKEKFGMIADCNLTTSLS